MSGKALMSERRIFSRFHELKERPRLQYKVPSLFTVLDVLDLLCWSKLAAENFRWMGWTSFRVDLDHRLNPFPACYDGSSFDLAAWKLAIKSLHSWRRYHVTVRVLHALSQVVGNMGGKEFGLRSFVEKLGYAISLATLAPHLKTDITDSPPQQTSKLLK
jgi:hypothetical protein